MMGRSIAEVLWSVESSRLGSLIEGVVAATAVAGPAGGAPFSFFVAARLRRVSVIFAWTQSELKLSSFTPKLKFC